MSGDVQPRKRKDKKKKRDDEASHGVHMTKMGSDDVLLHIHEEHGTGGHWCAKVIFFFLMTILMGLVCLIILENRGISDVDTPLSESRFSNYFDGWVDEHRDDHDDHHDSHGSLEKDDHDGDEHDDEDDHDEPFEEEPDHSEGDDEDVAEDENENVTPEEEEEDDDNATAENVTAEEEDDEEEEQDEEENDTADVDDNVTAEEADDDNITKETTGEQNDNEDDDDEGNDDANKTNEEDDDNVTKETSKPASQGAHDDDDDPFDEDDDDGTFEMVDNDAAELELLKEKARQQAAAESKQNAASAENDVEDEADNAPSWASSQIKPKTGGGPQSLEDDDLDLFENELRKANDEMMRERYADALGSFDRLTQKYPNEPQVYLGKAQTLDQQAEQRKSNRLLMDAIEMYKKYLEFTVKDNQLQEYRSAAERCVERMRFLGNYQQSLPIHQLLINKFPNESSIRNELARTFLMLNRLLDAKRILQEILMRWPNDGLALVHYGFVLKQLDHDYHNASLYLRQGIESQAPDTQDGRFYFQLGESLQRLGKQNEAVEVFRQGADLKLFPSVYQRSLYNEPNLKAQPFWSLEETTYEKFLKKLQDNWLAIKAEGLNVLSKTGYFLDETEDLKNKGDWKQFELFSRGRQRKDNCLKAPITCSFVNQFPAARDCRRGQVKFSVMHAGTHVWPHCGPTNCRLRAHLGLVVPSGTRLRVAEEERSWQEGKFLIFDDSFEHEVWHQGQGLRLVLIVDIWHPELTEQQRRSLSPI